jgi:hypothetical protein
VAAAGWAAGGGLIAATALRHADVSFDELRCRHCSASTPPGVTLEQFAMKSERQLLRIALFCASVGCCAMVTPTDTPSASVALTVCLQTFHTGTSRRMSLTRKTYKNGAEKSQVQASASCE